MIRSLSLFITCLLVVVLTDATASAQITVNAGGHARLVTEPSGARDDNNGGDTTTGALIGLNAGGIDNFMIFDFVDLSPTAGQTVTGATINFAVATGFTNANHGSVEDMINLHEIALGNLGWARGSGVIGGGDNPADDGSVSFLNRVQFSGGGTTEAWVDTGGSDVANLLGSLTLLDSQNGWNDPNDATGPYAPTVLSFTVDAATAQGWVDSGLGGLALSTTDDGDSRSRYNFLGNGSAASNAGSIVFSVVPEPGSVLILTAMGMTLLVRRKRR